MTHQDHALELDEIHEPELARLAREVRRTQIPIVLRENGQDVVIISPASRTPRRRRQGKTVTQADVDAALATAGAWKGLIDADQFKRDLNEAQSDDRSAVER